jgi:hypothetical protein
MIGLSRKRLARSWARLTQIAAGDTILAAPLSLPRRCLAAASYHCCYFDCENSSLAQLDSALLAFTIQVPLCTADAMAHQNAFGALATAGDGSVHAGNIYNTGGGAVTFATLGACTVTIISLSSTDL